MIESQITTLITTTFPDLQPVTSAGNTFFFLHDDRKIPLFTLVTTDEYDSASNLSRPHTYRLNLPLSKSTYESLFGPTPTHPIGTPPPNSPHDFTTLDTLMPHPIYAQMHWACILNPTEKTFHQKILPLLTEAHSLALTKKSNK